MDRSSLVPVDGVFAIVMTLLVLQVAVPRGSEGLLARELAALAPTFVTYAITLITLGVLWFGNRTQGELVVLHAHALHHRRKPCA